MPYPHFKANDIHGSIPPCWSVNAPTACLKVKDNGTGRAVFRTLPSHKYPSMQTHTFTASSVLERLATDEVFRRELIDGVVRDPDLMKSAAPHIIKLLELLKAKIADREAGK